MLITTFRSLFLFAYYVVTIVIKIIKNEAHIPETRWRQKKTPKSRIDKWMERRSENMEKNSGYGEMEERGAARILGS